MYPIRIRNDNYRVRYNWNYQGCRICKKICLNEVL